MTGYQLPVTATIGQKQYHLRPDFRNILEIFSWLERQELPEFLRWRVALELFYEETVEKKDLQEAGITPLLSENIERDALQKFSFVSPMAAIGAAFDVTAKSVQAPGKLQDMFCAMILEIKALSRALNADLPDNIVDINLNILNGLAPTTTASMQKDIAAGKSSEIDGLVFEVTRLGKRFGIPVPTYQEVSDIFHSKGF